MKNIYLLILLIALCSSAIAQITDVNTKENILK